MHNSLFSIVTEKSEDFYFSTKNFKLSRSEIMFKMINFNSIYMQTCTYCELVESKGPSRGVPVPVPM